MLRSPPRTVCDLWACDPISTEAWNLEVPEGTAVHAMNDGRVRFAGVMSGYGNVVWLEHGKNVLTLYAHLSEIRVTRGDEVDGGVVIGLSGATGDVDGPHLHFEVWRWGREVDPVPLLGGRPRGQLVGA